MGEVFKGYIDKKTPIIKAAKIRRVHAFGSVANIAQVELTGSARDEVKSVLASVRPARGDYVVLVDNNFIHMQKGDFLSRYQGA